MSPNPKARMADVREKDVGGSAVSGPLIARDVRIGGTGIRKSSRDCLLL